MTFGGRIALMRRWVLSVGGGLAISAVAVHAHHSIAGVYDSSRQVTIEAVISQFQFVNPHPYLVVDVRDGSGETQRWRLEMDNRHELVDIGFTNETLKPGDRVVVTGSLARRDANSLYIQRLDRRSDGFGYEQVGNSPRIRRR
jgi:hypothetical protein